MARNRSYLPPAVCDVCKLRPALGDTLWYSGVAWLCPACLADQTPGTDLITKAAHEAVQRDRKHANSRRRRASGEIESAEYYASESGWHGHAAESLKSHGDHLAKGALINRLEGCGFN